MAESDFEDTKAVARLPNLDIEIFHRRPWQGNEELLSITLRATPSFESFLRSAESANPFLFGPMAFNPMAFWLRAAQTAWSPWLRLAGASGRKQIGKE
jgi:hypothetical protein